jgi:hypothetical protein
MKGKEGVLAIPCARATRGRRLPSLDARTMGNRQAATPTPADREDSRRIVGRTYVDMDQANFKK